MMLKDSTTQTSAFLRIKDIPLAEELSDDVACAITGGQQSQRQQGSVDYHTQCRLINNFRGQRLNQPLWRCQGEVEDPADFVVNS